MQIGRHKNQAVQPPEEADIFWKLVRTLEGKVQPTSFRRAVGNMEAVGDKAIAKGDGRLGSIPTKEW